MYYLSVTLKTICFPEACPHRRVKCATPLLPLFSSLPHVDINIECCLLINWHVVTSPGQFSATPWTHGPTKLLLFMGFSRQGILERLPFPDPVNWMASHNTDSFAACGFYFNNVGVYSVRRGRFRYKAGCLAEPRLRCVSHIFADRL